MATGASAISIRSIAPVRRSWLWDKAGKLKTGLTSMYWLLSHYGELRDSIISLKHEVEILAPVSITSWHRGARYFKTTLRNGRKIFIKTDGQYRLLAQELAAAQRLRLCAKQGDIAPGVCFYELTGSYPLVGFEWLDAQPLEVALRRAVLRGRGQWLGDRLEAILESLKSSNVIHRDITPKNLLVTFGSSGVPDRLFLVDFAFAVIDGKSLADERVPRNELHDLCTGFKPASLVWDDAFSCLTILLLAERTYGVAIGAVRRKIEALIGKITHSVAAPDWS